MVVAFDDSRAARCTRPLDGGADAIERGGDGSVLGQGGSAKAEGRVFGLIHVWPSPRTEH